MRTLIGGILVLDINTRTSSSEIKTLINGKTIYQQPNSKFYS